MHGRQTAKYGSPLRNNNHHNKAMLLLTYYISISQIFSFFN